jgi:CheY-like chemotaxis protein
VPTARLHAAPRHSGRARGGRRGQPRGRPEDAPSRGTTISTSTAVALPSVLVVEDDPSQRLLLHEIFTLEGRAVSMAEHGGPALQRLHANADSLVVLLGLLMPKVNGEAVLEAVAADEGLARRHAFVMVTAAIPRATEGRVAELRQLLGIPLIAKPFTVSHTVSGRTVVERRHGTTHLA